METTQNISKPKTTSKDFFLHLGGVVFLYISVVSLLILLFSIIDQVFPNELFPVDPYAGGVSVAMAMLMVAFPLCILFLRAVVAAEREDLERREVWIRKAFLYCTLFVIVVAVAIDLIVLLSNFFGGEEITLGFALKVLSIIFVLGVVAGYYIYDLRLGETEHGARMRIRYAYAGGVFVLLAISLGFWVMGSPYTQREKRFDSARVENLSQIQNAIVNYWQSKEVLPPTLDILNDPLSGRVIPVDPKTKMPYEYEVTGKLSFRVCATFGKETPVGNTGFGYGQTMPVRYKGDGMSVGENWKHGVGRTCFDRTIDREMYPPFKSMPVPVQVFR